MPGDGHQPAGVSARLTPSPGAGRKRKTALSQPYCLPVLGLLDG